MALKKLAKGGLERAVASLEPWLRRRPRTVILCYHRISHPDLPDPFPQPVTTVPCEVLAAQLRWLSTFAEFTTPGAIACDPAGGRRPRIAVTFDDAYRDNVTLGEELFREVGAEIAWFVPTAYVEDAQQLPWWDLAAWLRATAADRRGTVALPEGGRLDLADGEARAQLAASLERDAERSPPADLLARVSALSTAIREVAALPGNAMVRPAELREAAARGVFRIGCHTVVHPNLALLDDDAQRAEIDGGRRALEGLGVEPAPWFAYPFGKARWRTARTPSLVADAGFEVAVTTELARVPADVDPRLVPRISVDGRWDHERFRARVLLAS